MHLPLLLTTLVKVEFRFIGNFLLLPSCPDYPECTLYCISMLVGTCITCHPHGHLLSTPLRPGRHPREEVGLAAVGPVIEHQDVAPILVVVADGEAGQQVLGTQ